MTWIDNIANFFEQSASETQNKTLEGACPNCWGKQEYDGKVRRLYKDKQIDVNNHKAHYSFIRNFVIKHIDGIRLKKGNNGYECPTCVE